jgi:hypothetical protein
MMNRRVMRLTIGRVRTRTQEAVPLHRRNTAKDETETTEICMMSSTEEMHTAGLKTGVRSTSALNSSSMKKGTMSTMVSIMMHLTDSVLPKGAQCRRGQDLFP